MRVPSVVAALVAVVAVARPAQAQEPAGERFLCRGPFAFGIDQSTDIGELQPATSWWVVEFTPSRAPAGAQGERLQPGSCGFAERGVAEDEPTRVSFLRARNPTLRIGDRDDLPQSQFATQNARNQLGAWLERCAQDADCVIRVQVVADRSPDRVGFEGTGPALLLPARTAARTPAARPSATPVPREPAPTFKPASLAKPVTRRAT